MDKRKLTPYSAEWEKAANQEARIYCPDIYPCQKCSYPVMSGFCCVNCEDSNPSKTQEEDDAWDAKYGKKV